MYVKYFCQVSIEVNKRWRSDSYFKMGPFGTFHIQQRKNDVIVTLYRFDPDSLYHKIFILSQSNSVQNLSSLTLKTKEL